MFLGNGHSRRLPNNGGAHLAHCSSKRRIHAALTFLRRRPGPFTKCFVPLIGELPSRIYVRMVTVPLGNSSAPRKHGTCLRPWCAERWWSEEFSATSVNVRASDEKSASVAQVGILAPSTPSPLARRYGQHAWWI